MAGVTLGGSLAPLHVLSQRSDWMVTNVLLTNLLGWMDVLET